MTMAVHSITGLRHCLLTVLTALVACTVSAPAGAASGEPAVPANAAAAPIPTVAKHSPFRSTMITDKAKKQYVAMWGVDKLRVSSTSSGNLIRFTYRVEVAELAKQLAEKNATPYLYGLASHVMLQVPVMDKVGPLRQSAPPVAGQEYWMVFSNKGNLVKVGDRVNVVIGTFHADGLMVE
jgi:hypothetical protein